MVNSRHEAFKKTVFADFKRDNTTEDVVRKYEIKSKSTAERPGRSTIYNWFKEFKAKMDKNKGSPSGNLDARGGLNGPESAQKGAPKATITSSPEPQIPTVEAPAAAPSGSQPGQGENPNSLNGQSADGKKEEVKREVDEEEKIEFDLMGKEIPSQLEAALNRRFNIDVKKEVPGYMDLMAVQERTTPKIIKKYVPDLRFWALEINFGYSYLKGMWDVGNYIRVKKGGGGSGKGEEVKKDEEFDGMRVEIGPSPGSLDVVPDGKGGYTFAR